VFAVCKANSEQVCSAAVILDGPNHYTIRYVITRTLASRIRSRESDRHPLHLLQPNARYGTQAHVS